MSVRLATRRGVVAGFLLHAVAAAWVFAHWGPGLRGGVLAWMDFPVSLAYLGLTGRALLTASLIVGGVWWALLGALFSRALGAVVGPRRAS
jgi:hypothetical protein